MHEKNDLKNQLSSKGKYYLLGGIVVVIMAIATIFVSGSGQFQGYFVWDNDYPTDQGDVTFAINVPAEGDVRTVDIVFTGFEQEHGYNPAQGSVKLEAVDLNLNCRVLDGVSNDCDDFIINRDTGNRFDFPIKLKLAREAMDGLIVGSTIDSFVFEKVAEGELQFSILAADDYNQVFGDTLKDNTGHPENDVPAYFFQLDADVTASVSLFDNRAPVIGETSNLNTSIVQGAINNFSANGITDPDGDQVTITWSVDGIQSGTGQVCAPGETCDSSLDGITFDTTGEHTVKIVASDSLLETEVLFNITVLASRPPVIGGLVSPATGVQGIEYDFVATGITDPEDEELTLKWFVAGTQIGPDETCLAGEACSSTLSYTFDDIAEHRVKITVTDPFSNEVFSENTINIGVNNTPVITGDLVFTPNPPLAGDTISFSGLRLADIDSDTVNVVWHYDGPTSGEMCSETLSNPDEEPLICDFSFNTDGSYMVWVEATDELNSISSEDYVVEVLPALEIPVVEIVMDAGTFTTADPITFTATLGAGNYGDAVEYVWTYSQEGGAYNPLLCSNNPDPSNPICIYTFGVGSYKVKGEATNTAGTGSDTTDTFEVTLFLATVDPVIDSLLPNDYTGETGDEEDFIVSLRGLIQGNTYGDLSYDWTLVDSITSNTVDTLDTCDVVNTTSEEETCAVMFASEGIYNLKVVVTSRETTNNDQATTSILTITDPLAPVQGIVFYDADGDGDQAMNASEPGVRDATVQIYSGSPNQGMLPAYTVTTDENGVYTFQDITNNGEYYIKVVTDSSAEGFYLARDLVNTHDLVYDPKVVINYSGTPISNKDIPMTTLNLYEHNVNSLTGDDISEILNPVLSYSEEWVDYQNADGFKKLDLNYDYRLTGDDISEILNPVLNYQS